MSGGTSSHESYIVITAARNEQEHIGRCLNTMKCQTVRPLKWFIVVNGSNDDTEAIVRQQSREQDWIELISLETKGPRNWGGKVEAINLAFRRAAALDFAFVANLDADVSLDPHYFATLLHFFAADPQLGVAGGELYEVRNGSPARPICHDQDEVSGPCQFFRRSCFEDIGAYLENRVGIEDAAAVTMARMKGWRVMRVPDCKLWHHRPLGGVSGRSFYQYSKLYGRKDYLLGDHPLWEFGRFFYRLREKPYILGSFLRLAAYGRAWLGRHDRPVSGDFISFRRYWQLGRLRRILTVKRGQL